MVDMMVDVVSYNDADIILNNELDPAMPEQIGLRALSRIIIINYCRQLYFKLSIFGSESSRKLCLFLYHLLAHNGQRKLQTETRRRTKVCNAE